MLTGQTSSASRRSTGTSSGRATRRSCRRSRRDGNRVLFVENTGVRRADAPRSAARCASGIRNWWRGTKGFRAGADEPVRVLAARAAVAVFARWRAGSTGSCCARAPPLDARDRVLPADRLDVPADAARARPDRATIDPRADDLLLHRRLRRRARPARRSIVASEHRLFRAGRSGLRHVGEAARARRAGSASSVHLFPVRRQTSTVRGASGSRRRDSGGSARATSARSSATSAACISGSIRICSPRVADAMPEATFVFIGPAQSDVSTLEAPARTCACSARARTTQLPGYIKGFDVGIVPYRADRIHGERLPDEAERVPRDGHSGRRDRSARNPAVQRRARGRRRGCRRR